MVGTSFSVTAARRFTPPRKIKPQITTKMIPMIQDGTPKAVWKVEPMELDCTMQPIKPSARMIATAKKPAKNLPNPPENAFVM